MSENNSGHIDENGENKAILNYSSDYAKSGYDEICANSDRIRVYGNTIRIMKALKALGRKPKPATVDPASREHAARYYFDYENNFTFAGAPYPNRAHHLLPVSVFAQGGLLSDEQLLVMKKVEYDINNGENIMFLPFKLADANIHSLPVHSGQHPKYTNCVKEDARDIANKLQEAIKEDQPHQTWNPPEDIYAMLINLQQDYWDLLKNAGPVKIHEFEKPQKKSGLGRS